MAQLSYIILGISVLILICVNFQNLVSIVSPHLIVMKLGKYRSLGNFSNRSLYISKLTNRSLLPFNNAMRINSTTSSAQTFHHDGVAYDFYSKDDLNQTNAGIQWEIWPLPHETEPYLPLDDPNLSPSIVSNLSFVHSIYVLSDPRLVERHNNLRKAFHHQGLDFRSIDWRMKWNRTTCNSESYHSYVYQRLNLKDKPLNERQQKTCPLAMKHVDVWYEMAEKKIPLGLILEDDAIFVPFFKEKFTRMIYAAIDMKILRLNGTCVEPQSKPISNNEVVHQNPMIVIGICFDFHGSPFRKDLSNAPPVLTPHKSDPSRCSHAYLLTSCSAQALIDQIQVQKNDYQPSDFLQNYLFPPSPTLQAFWMDPPLVYQGNQVTDLDKLPTFASQTYNTLD